MTVAGDWIKVEHATLDKPEVLRMAEMLGISRDAIVGLLVRYFVWLDRNLSPECPDCVRNVSRKSLDESLHCSGFAASIEAIGWARFDDDAWLMHVINADRHNGKPAKTRAVESKKKSGKRLDAVREMSGSKPDTIGTREEKNITTTPIVPADFERFWRLYPKRVGKADAMRAWLKVKPDALLTARIFAAVEQQRRSDQWTKDDGKFIPHPSTWLNQHRWDDEPVDIVRPSRRVVV